MHTEFRWGNLRERDHFEPRVVGKIILRSGSGMEAWTGLIWLKTG
jgi:hypothetical protein